ncbi:DUF3857 domain-containing protein [Robertkochia flava]|uniref:DUF3857 domain-containing protein n=1 Tax=Robertkochia flava TaxID=3447986 RepID=UPI001CC9E4AB|nr:DUF3857 domain-containing protein [Robertkochia marina]
MVRFYLSFILSLVVLSAATAQDYRTSLIPDSLKYNANAVVRNYKASYEVEARDKLKAGIRWAITVFDKDGLGYLNAFAYYNDAIRIKSMEAIVYDRNGEEIDKFRKKDFKDVSAVSGGTMYSDSRVLYLDYTPVTYPFTMEFSFESTTSNTSYLPRFYFLSGYGISTEFASYELHYTPEMEAPRVLESNVQGLDIKKEVQPGRLYYEARGLTSVKREDYAPQFSEVVPNIEVAMNQFHLEGREGYAANWEQLGSWMYKEILAGRQELSGQSIEEVRALTEGIDDIYEKSKIVYNYVQEQTRYISVQVGIGGIQPIAAIEVDDVKYGDCKGLTNYTIALLNAVGVEAYYVHVESGNAMQSFSEDFASLAAGDHVILAIPYKEGYIWSDCTSKIHPFGFIGDFTDNRNVLVITPAGGRLERTVAYLDSDNRLDTKAECYLYDNGALEASLELTAEGIEYDHYFPKWEMIRDESDMKEWYANFWPYLNGFRLDSYSHQNDRDAVVLTENLEVEVGSYMSKAGEQLLLSLNVFNRKVELPDRYRNRKLPFQVNRGKLHTDEYTFHLPEGYRPESIPDSVSLKTEFGDYAISCKANEDGTLTYKRSFLLKNGSYPKEKYGEFRNFLKKVRSSDQAKILLVPNGELAQN